MKQGIYHYSPILQFDVGEIGNALVNLCQTEPTLYVDEPLYESKSNNGLNLHLYVRDMPYEYNDEETTFYYRFSYDERLSFTNLNTIELSKADTSILKAIKYMENNFLNDPSLTETAAYINFSPAHFSRLFKKVIGVSYSEYLNYIRVEMGRNLLLTTNLSIGEIAQLSGFNNSNYFCNVMKKILGDNPSKIRRLK